MAVDRALIQQTILAQVRQRGLNKTICPSEVARALGGTEWRSWMESVRSVGSDLANRGNIEVTQGGQVVDPATAKGAIRFRITQAYFDQQSE